MTENKQKFSSLVCEVARSTTLPYSVCHYDLPMGSWYWLFSFASSKCTSFKVSGSWKTGLYGSFLTWRYLKHSLQS